jgi:hypothetical protein
MAGDTLIAAVCHEAVAALRLWGWWVTNGDSVDERFGSGCVLLVLHGDEERGRWGKQTDTLKILKLPRLCYSANSMRSWKPPHVPAIGWITLLVCAWTTADLVIDLVFEEPHMAVNAQAATEEPDNPAEHLLFPSQQVDNSSEIVVPTAPAADIGMFSIALTVADSAARATACSHSPPAPPRLNSFSVPLRI